MIVIGLFLLAVFFVVGWLLRLAYRETEQDFPSVHRRQSLQDREVGSG
jgi:hypothetical protein